MANSSVLIDDLKSRCCSSALECSLTVEVRLLRFSEARNFKRGGELTGVNMFLIDSKEIDFRCNGKFTGFNMDKGWCYVSCSRCTKKIQRNNDVCLSYQDGNDAHGDGMHGIVSEPTKVDVDGNDREEALTIGTSSGGVNPNKTHAATSFKVLKRARIA